MVDIGSILLLAGHLICMNVASVGPLLCLVIVSGTLPRRDLGSVDNREQAGTVASRLALWSVSLLLLGIVLGVALGCLDWSTGDRALVQTLPSFGRKVFWGVLEICCSLGWMLGYWFWLSRRPPQSSWGRFIHAGLAILSATNLLYHFPPLLTVMTRTAAGEIAIAGEVDADTFRQLMWTPNVMAHSLHFWLASAAVSGMFLCWLVRNLERAEPYLVLGGRVALGATILQIPSGLWLLFASPPGPQSRLLGSHTAATSLFVGSLFCVFLLLQRLMLLAIGEADQKHARVATLLMAATVVLMTGALHYLRG